MTVRNSWIALLGLLVSQALFAGTVRTVAVNNGAMAPIFLRMGKSTVLRFVEKPKKVVIGNQNYYGLEFIENDVAIQPLGAVGTNLFVYTENHTYGFLLTPGERYDDLVFVRWRYPQVGNASDTAPRSAKITLPNLSFTLGGDLRVTVGKIQGPSTFGLHLIDCTIENLSKRELSMAGLVLTVTRNAKSIAGQSTVVDLEKLKPGEKTKARIVLKLGTQDAITLEGKLGHSTGKITIGRKYL